MTEFGELLALHEIQRTAHLRGDADLFATTFGETIDEASSGETRRITRDELRDRFADTFSRLRYLEWSDSAAPIGGVTGDLGWMLVRVHARRESIDGTPLPEFDASWIAVYERRHGHWGLRAISSSLEMAG